MGRFWAQIKAIWQRMELPQRVSLVLIGVVFLALLGFIGYGASQPTWRVLATDLSAARTAEISAFLRAQGIDHKIEDRERTILVPSGEVYTLRNELAEQDLIDTESDGFKLLDQGGFGMSNHMEMRMYDRAVAGELEKSFAEIDGVRSARVIISRPQPSPFIREEDEPAISIKLAMRSGQRLSERQLHGITHLAAAAVEGASPDRVQVMDGKGLLSRAEEDPTAMRAGTNHELTLAMEQELISKAQRQLDRILGPGRSTVSVALDLDFTVRAKNTSRVYDPVVIESRTITRESSTPVPSNGGVAGTQPNVEGVGGAGAAAPLLATETMEEEHTTSAGSKENTTVQEEVGSVRGMTVSIVIDQKRVENPVVDDNGEPTGEVEVRYEDYTAAERDAFRQTVLDAIGFAAAKGAAASREPQGNVDERFSVSVATMPLYRPDEESATVAMAGFMGTSYSEEQVQRWGSWAVAAIIALGLLMVARGQLKRGQAAIREEAERRQREAEAAKQAEEAARKERESHEKDGLMARRRDELRGSLRQEVADDPDTAAQVVRAWLHG